MCSGCGVEGVIGEADAWAAAAQGDIDVPVDVVLAAPASEFADLYGLVDVCVTMPASRRFAKADRLAAPRGAAAGSLWMILEEDPAVVVDDGADARPPNFVPKHAIEEGKQALKEGRVIDHATVVAAFDRIVAPNA